MNIAEYEFMRWRFVDAKADLAALQLSVIELPHIRQK